MGKDLEKSIELVNQVRAILKKRTVLTTNKAAMLAISGGQDSACLIAIAVQIRDQWKGPFGIISCNHLWQHDSFYGLFHVCRLAFLIDRPLYFVAAPFDVFNEADARSWRYNTIQRIGSLYHFSTICTGHTASDRVETILFNFVRGSGIRGLSSLGWNRWFIGSYPNQYHSANFEGTASSQSSAFFDPKPPLASLGDARPSPAAHPQGMLEGAPKVGAQKVGDGEGRRGHTDVRCLVGRIVGLGGRVGALGAEPPCKATPPSSIPKGCTTFKAPAPRGSMATPTLARGGHRTPTYTKQRPHSNHPHPVPSLVEKQQLFKWYLLLAQFFEEGQSIYIKARNIDGKSIALRLSRARDASLSSFLVFSTKFFGINRCLPSRRMGSLIRPLLSLSRNDVKKLCQFWGLPIYPDVTNQTVAFSRNRIRKQLLPALRVAFNPQIDSVLSQSAEIMFAERLQQDLLASKLLRAYQHVPKLERGHRAEEKGNQAKYRSHGMKRQTVQRSTRALMGQVKPRFRWNGGRAPQRPGGPKRPLTSADMSVVRATRANYGRALVSKSRDLQAVWLGLGKTGAFLGAREPCHRQKQYTSLLHKRRGCLFLPQVGIFFTTSSLSSVNVIQSF